MTATDVLIILACLFWIGLLTSVIMGTRRGTKVATPLLAVHEKRRKKMADMLTYAVVAPEVVDGDVVKRELSVVVNGLVQSVVVYSPETVVFDDIEVPQDATVLLQLVDVDDAGNRSEPAELEFVAVDTLPPTMPGGLSVNLVSERRSSVPVVDEPEVDVDADVDADVVDEPVAEVEPVELPPQDL